MRESRDLSARSGKLVRSGPPVLRSVTIAVVPGLKAPKDINSFFRPLINECKMLAKGVYAYDTACNEGFDLHVYPISIHGDMQAIKHCTNLKGSNAFWPCRTCLIQAVRDESKPQSTYYTLLYQCNDRPPRHRYYPQELDLGSAYRPLSHQCLTTQRSKSWGIIVMIQARE